MTQTELAGSLNKSVSYTNQTLSGRKPASARWVDLVADVLELPATERLRLHTAAAKDHGFKLDLGQYHRRENKA